MTDGFSEINKDELECCDICKVRKLMIIATVDGKTKLGPWVYMCEDCFREFGVGIGLGRGQRLIYNKNLGVTNGYGIS